MLLIPWGGVFGKSNSARYGSRVVSFFLRMSRFALLTADPVLSFVYWFPGFAMNCSKFHLFEKCLSDNDDDFDWKPASQLTWHGIAYFIVDIAYISTISSKSGTDADPDVTRLLTGDDRPSIPACWFDNRGDNYNFLLTS